MEMQYQIHQIIISSYLHDIGKLLWRGGKTSGNNLQVKHSNYVYDFFHNTLSYCNVNFDSSWKELGIYAGYHHLKDRSNKKDRSNDDQKRHAWIVYMADNIGSQERINQNQQINQDTTYPTRIDEQNIENNEHIKKKGLTMVFDNLFVGHDGKNNYKCHNNYIPQKLEDVSIGNMISTDKGFEFRGEEDFVAEVGKMIGGDDVKAGFEKLATQFCEDLKSIFTGYANRHIRELSQSDYNHIIYQLDILCQNYMTLVPSDAYKSIGDISLYDHTKTVVANAVVLYHHFQNEKIKTSYSTTQVCEYSCTLIAGDFPSIQKYINKAFAVSHGLAKRIRARSFVVQAINEAVIEYIIEKLNLSRANVLINAGGKFVIYSHKDVDISGLSDDINTFLIQKYHGDIKINMISQKMKIGDIFDSVSDNAKSNIGDVFAQLFDRLSRHKGQVRSDTNMQDITKQHFNTGIQYDNIGEGGSDNISMEGNTNIHLIEEKQIGEELTKNVSVYIIYRKDDKFFFDLKRSHEGLQSDYIYLQFNARTLSNIPKKIVAKSINLYVPKEGDTIKEFDKILGQEQYLTLIKGDVDNMSIILKHGLEYIYSVSRFVQFSRFLELFFGTLTQKFLQNQYNDVYTIFSGGDDFEFIMPFSHSVDFVDRYQQELSAFVGGSDYLHFSSSIVLFKDKMPIKTISQQGESMLKSAKKAYKENMKYSEDLQDLKKYGVCIFEYNQTIIFEKEKGQCLKSIIDQIIEDIDFISDTNTYTLLMQIEKIKNIISQSNISYIDYHHKISQLLYMITKNYRSNKKQGIQKKVNDFIAGMKNRMNIEIGKPLETNNNSIQNISSLSLAIKHKLYTIRNN